MMTCRDYIFRLTSGQLGNAPFHVRLDARLHTLMCQRCRTFTQNDASLDDMLQAYRDLLKRENEPDSH